jgi:hypothetical protein
VHEVDGGGLFGHGGKHITVPVPDPDHDGPTGGIEVPLAGGVPDRRAFGTDRRREIPPQHARKDVFVRATSL